MKKTFASRILAVLMVFCLIAQFAPASVAASVVSTDANGVITFNFGSTGINDIKAVDIDTHGWKMNLEGTSPSIPYNAHWGTKVQVNGIDVYMEGNAANYRDCFAVDLKVPTAGYYTVTINGYMRPGTYAVKVNGEDAGTMTSSAYALADHTLNKVFTFRKGTNTVALQMTSGSGAVSKIVKVVLTPAQAPASASFSLDFTKDNQVTKYADTTLAGQGLKLIYHTATHNNIKGRLLASNAFNQYFDYNGTNANSTISFKYSNSDPIGMTAGFMFEMEKAGQYDMIIPMTEDAGHGGLFDVRVNTGYSTTETSVGKLDTAPDSTKITKKNSGNVHYVGTANLAKGFNALMFKSENVVGYGNMYFENGVFLTKPAATTGATCEVADTGSASASGNVYTFAANDTLDINVKAPSYGLYYVYLKAENDAINGFRGTVVDNQYSSQNLNLFGIYENETDGATVVRPMGPYWFDATKFTTLTLKASAACELNISSIELHEVEKTLWMMDNASNQNYRGVTLNTHNWQPSSTTEATLYERMLKGAQYGGIHFATAHRNADGTVLNIAAADRIAFDFDTPVAGTYLLKGKFKASADANNVTVRMEDAAGESLPLDSKLSLKSATTEDVEKTIGVVTLEEGMNTVVFRRNDGGSYLRLKSLTFEPYTGQVADSAAVSVKDAEIKVGATTQASVAVKAQDAAYTGDDYTVTYKSSDEKVATVDAQGVVTAKGTGSADITATVAVQGRKITADKATVTVASAASIVTGTPDVVSPFAEKYAYIEENNDGTYNVTFIGGINKLEGYSAVGFEIDVAGNKAYSDSANVYTSLDVNGSKYTAADNYSASYIFIGSREGIAAGSKVVARPYVVVNGEKQFLANAELTLQF